MAAVNIIVLSMSYLLQSVEHRIVLLEFISNPLVKFFRVVSVVLLAI